MTGEEIKNMCDAMEEDAQQKIIEGLENRIAKLIKERDAYDARRCEAMRSSEEWRNKYHGLLGKPSKRKIERITCSGTIDDTRAIAVCNDDTVWTLEIGVGDCGETWVQLPSIIQDEQ